MVKLFLSQIQSKLCFKCVQTQRLQPVKWLVNVRVFAGSCRSQYLLDQFLSDSVDLGLDALLRLGHVLRVERPVESQQVMQRALIRCDVCVL